MPTPTDISAMNASIIICTSFVYFYCIRSNLIKGKMCTMQHELCCITDIILHCSSQILK